MKLSIENMKLTGAINILNEIPLRGLKSIHRSRLNEQLQEHLKRVADEEKALKKEYSTLDEDGEPIIKDNKYDIKDLDAFKAAMKEFYDEKVVIDSGDLQVTLKSVKQSLEDSEMELKGESAFWFADLYEAIQGSTEDDE